MNHTWWDAVLDAWPMTLFVPGVMLALGVLVVIIKVVDGDA